MNSPALWHLLVTQCIQLTVLIGIVGTLALCCARRRPHLAHLLLLLLLIKCLTPPIVPGLWLPYPQVTTVSPATTQVPAMQVSVPPNETYAQSPSTSKVPTITDASPTSIQAAEAGHFHWSTWLLAAWLLGALVVILYTTAQWWRASYAWGARAGLASDSLRARCNQTAIRLGVRRPVRLVVSQSGFGPLVTGWLRPTIVLPECLVSHAGEKELELALAHELIHVRRGDTLTTGLQAVARAIWWFHPLVWWMNGLLDRACELCCDDEVIASLKCKPVHYAHCLLEVVKRKHALRHVMALPGSRPVSITASRLSRLSRPPRQFFQRTPRSYWAMFAAAALVMLPGKPLPSSPQPQQASADTDSTKPAATSAAAAFERADWDRAITAYSALVEEEPRDGLSWYRLGYALHAVGRLEEAIDAHKKAAEFPVGRPTALYNLACAHALMGQSEQALVELENAIDSGFRAKADTLASDADLDQIRDHPKFAELARRAGERPVRGHYRDLDFMIGVWLVHNDEGQLLGRSTITKDERGFLITEKWEAANGSTGTGIVYYDPKMRAWRQTFVGMFGNVIHLQGQHKDGQLSMLGESLLPDGTSSPTRSLTIARDDGSFDFLLENSTDSGETWQTDFNGRYTPAASTR